MSNRTRSSARKLAAALVTGAVAVCLAVGPAPASAQDQAAAQPLRVNISTAATGGYVRPYADVSVSSAAYVAVFEVEPDIGAVMLWPDGSVRSQGLARGHVSVELAGPRQARYRQMFYDRLYRRFLMASQIRPRAYYVAIASRRPLDLSRLESGRIFSYPQSYGTGYDVARALVDAVVRGPRSDWDYDVTSLVKGGDRLVTLAGYAPYTTPYSFSALCTGAGQFGYFPAFGLYTPWSDCGPTFYGNPYGFAWWWPFRNRPPVTNGPEHVADGTPGVVKTDSMRVGNPRPVTPPRVLPDAPTAAGRDQPVEVAGLNVGTPRPANGAGVAPEAPTAGRDGPKVLPPVKISVPGREKKQARQKEMDPEKVRQVLHQLADATRTARIDPGVLARDRQEFRRAGLSDPGRVSIDMVRQRVATSERLFTRLRDLGVPADQALHAATASGRAPEIRLRSRGASLIGAPRSGGVAARPGGSGGASARSSGRSRSGSAHATARARPAPHPAPRRPAHVSHSSSSSHSRPARPSRPSKPEKGGGSGHH